MKEPVYSPKLMFRHLNPGRTFWATCLSILLKRPVNFVAMLFVMTIVHSEAGAAENFQATWQKANAFYQQKEYDSAAYYFEQIASAKPADATVFYNLGNTYYRLNNIGSAVLNYERALKRKPAYREAADNLALTQSRIPGFIRPAQDIFFITWWKAMIAPGTIVAWSVTSLLLFIGLIALLLYKRLRKGVYIRPQYIGALSTLWVLSLLMAFAASRSLMADVKAVVVSANATISSKASKIPAAVPEGTSVNVLSANAGAYEVELPDGRTGFLQKELLQLVD